MSKTTPSEPVCLYDRMAASAAQEAGFPSPTSPPTVSVVSIVVVSVASTLGAVALVSAITYLIRRRLRLAVLQQSLHGELISARADIS
jgi:hypothetical protein